MPLTRCLNGQYAQVRRIALRFRTCSRRNWRPVIEEKKVREHGLELGAEFIDENGGGPGVRLRRRQQKKDYDVQSETKVAARPA